jgi:hypothetical protein
MARGAAGRQLRGRGGPEPTWGLRRFSRRRVVGTATSAMVAASALRFVPAAMGAPACQPPCLQAAANRYSNTMNKVNNAFGNKLDDLQNAYDDAVAARNTAKTAKGRAAASRQMAKILRQEQGYLNRWQDQQSFYYERMLGDQDKCNSDAQCGDPVKFPGGQPTTPGGTGTSSCGDPRTACGNLCCSSGSRCCSACKTCCVDVVSCSDCCG